MLNPSAHELTEFCEYVTDFYHPKTGLYPIRNFNSERLFEALNTYFERIQKGDLEYVHYSWGDGDSLGRERVRDILLENPKLSWSK